MVRPIKSGRNRQRVLLFDVPEHAVDTWGQPSLTPVQITNPNATDGGFWAEVRPLKGSEILNVAQVWATASHMVRMRWLGSTIPETPDNPNGLILPNMKIQLILDNSILNVLFANDVEKRHHFWELTCEMHVGSVS